MCTVAMSKFELFNREREREINRERERGRVVHVRVSYLVNLGRKMVRAPAPSPCCEKMGMKKGPWTHEEDEILISYIQQYGHANWRALPKQAGESNTVKRDHIPAKNWGSYI